MTSGLTAIAMSLIVACLALNITPSVAAQDAERVQLGVKPVGVDGSYFEVTMAPGESRQLTVEFGNFGSRDAVAMTYPADVYSLVNGGMGVRLAGEATSGTTSWLGFAGETMPLAAGEGQLRTFAVSVPDDAAPGEYITSVVIQDATPAGDSDTSGVAANRVNRQAIAVAVTVPGPIVPGLTLGAVEQHVAGGRSIITVEVENSGNVRLQPSGELVLSDAAGGELARFPVAMDSVYVGTRTVAEIPFTAILDPGEYTVVLSLADLAQTIAATTPQLPLSVPASNALAATAAPSASLASVMTQPPSPEDGGRAGFGQRLFGAMPLVAALVVGVLALAGGGVVVSRRGLPRMSRRPAIAQAVPVSAPPATVTTRPATIRQLSVPKRNQDVPSPEQPSTEAPRFRKVVLPEAGSRFAETARTRHPKGA